MKKIIAGLTAGIIMLFANMLVGVIFQFLVPSLKEEYRNQNLFRPWSDPLMLLMFIQPFLVGIILAWIWGLIKNNIKGKTLFQKGIRFGFIYWIVAIPGMLISYGTFPISLILVISWSIGILIQSLCLGVIFSKMLK